VHEVRVGRRIRGEEKVGQAIGDDAVDLFGHRHIE